jgi:hypothetical protein
MFFNKNSMFLPPPGKFCPPLEKKSADAYANASKSYKNLSQISFVNFTPVF